MITIYTFTFNEENFIRNFCEWYRHRFPHCDIVVFDNYSTDRTLEIAAEFGCFIRKWDTEGKFNDLELAHLKNNCWKNSLTDWNIVCDIDEFLDVFPKDLKGCNILRTCEVLMTSIHEGRPHSVSGSKRICFNKSVGNINFQVGAHKCFPNFPIYSEQVFFLYHFRYNRYGRYKDINKRRLHKKYSGHYSWNKIRQRFELWKLKRKSINFRT